jgi:tetratricopeptide (TPR) repeat protein
VTDSNPLTAESLCERGLDLLASGSPAEAAEAFREAVALSQNPAGLGLIEAHHGLIRALRDAGRLDQSVAAAMALTALTPGDPLAHTALSISLQAAGRIPQAEAAAARARVLEWKIQLGSPSAPDTFSADPFRRDPEP